MIAVFSNISNNDSYGSRFHLDILTDFQIIKPI